MDSRSVPAKIAKYFAHGLPFALVMFGLAFLWSYLVAPLGLDLGLLALGVVFVALAVAFGVLNSLLTGKLWFPMRRGAKVFIGQGLLLFFAFFFIEYIEIYALIPLFLDLTMLEQILVVVVLAAVYAFGDGYVAKAIGGHWRVLGVQTEMMERAAELFKTVEVKANNPDGTRCPRCGGVNLVVAADHSAYCLDCKRGLRREVMSHASG